ncbi:hypothetical protein MKQ70_16685 [Chitinophaga sedimenti]|uniref:hypothetical protein n=1 Tax=Chitinophaga sedimenti TaxID=2033606 RepID=UPI002006BF2E|nr:hypothetical protein [Chitinophaga sedimenti]MCK7556565.1 hypothetical protein [Chitinophaga sedimenti]
MKGNVETFQELIQSMGVTAATAAAEIHFETMKRRRVDPSQLTIKEIRNLAKAIGVDPNLL